MALDDAAVIIPGTGYVFVAPAGTAAPASKTDPGSPWRDLGHTSIDDGLTITKDGGDSNILGTWRNPALRDRRDPVVFALTIHLLQLSNDTLSMYFGVGDTTVDGVFGVALIPTPVELAMFVRIVDGANEMQVYLPKVSVGSDDDVEVDVENFLAFPVRATILGITGSALMEFYGDDLGLRTAEVQSLAITGVPTGGTFTLTLDGDTTAAIAYNAAASAVQSALRLLDTPFADGVVCSGGALPAVPVVITFAADLADNNAPLMTATGSFTGGTSPAAAVTTTTPGS